MESIQVGVLGCSSFARRAMLPALRLCPGLKLSGVASRDAEKARTFANEFECEGICGYDALLERSDIELVYIPLPTGMHEEWCMKALQSGKHLLVEKSFAMDFPSAERMIALAKEKNLLVMENFQFQTHSQWSRIQEAMTSGELGDVHLVRSTFGFPSLPKENFRWKRESGGGALLDTGAYMVMVSRLLLGSRLEVLGASLLQRPEEEVDCYGEAMLRNSRGQIAQVAFGFDYHYQCCVELLGTRGKLTATRVFTAPPDCQPRIVIESAGVVEECLLPEDNHYLNMWNWYQLQLRQGDFKPHWQGILDQAFMIAELRRTAGV